MMFTVDLYGNRGLDSRKCTGNALSMSKNNNTVKHAVYSHDSTVPIQCFLPPHRIATLHGKIL